MRVVSFLLDLCMTIMIYANSLVIICFFSHWMIFVFLCHASQPWGRYFFFRSCAMGPTLFSSLSAMGCQLFFSLDFQLQPHGTDKYCPVPKSLYLLELELDIRTLRMSNL